MLQYNPDVNTESKDSKKTELIDDDVDSTSKTLNYLIKLILACRDVID